MSGQEEFFSPKHKQILSIAMWAKYLAWVMLIFYIFRAGMIVFQYRISLQGFQAMQDSSQSVQEFLSLLNAQPSYAIDMISSMVIYFLRGMVFYLALKGISLGLNMIVETDINYRENKTQGGEQ